MKINFSRLFLRVGLLSVVGLIIYFWPREKIIEVPHCNNPKLRLDSIVDIIDIKIVDLVSFFDLMNVEEFQAIMSNPELYVKETEILLKDSTVSERKKIILILAMQSLEKERFFDFLKFCEGVYVVGQLSENAISCAILPGNAWSTRVQVYFYRSEVREVLKSIRNNPSNTNTLNSLIDEILSGKLWMKQFLRNSVPQ